jgi:drug/metabolite transporter (DMT)-like permease
MLPISFFALRDVERSYWKYLALSGLLGNGLPALLFCVAQTGINSSTAALLNSTTPLFTLTMGLLFFHLKPTRAQMLGVAIGFAGAITLVLVASKEAPAGNPLYGLLVVCAAVCYGFSANIIGRFLAPLKPMHINAIILLPIAPLYAIYLALSDFGHIVHTNPAAWQALGFVAILAIVGTAISNMLFTYLIKTSSVLFATSVAYLIPIVAMMWGLLDGEQLTALHVVGIAVILTGVYLVNRKKTTLASATAPETKPKISTTPSQKTAPEAAATDVAL